METLNQADYFDCDKAISILPRSPQADFPEHEHRFHELVLIKDGRAIHYIDGCPCVAGKGSVFYLKVGQAHYFDQTENLCLTNVVFSPEQMQACSALNFLPKSADSGTLRVGAEVLNNCERLFSAIQAECGKHDACATSMVESLFAQLIVLLSRAEQCILSNQPEDDRIAALVRYIDQRYGDEFDLCELAEQFSIPLRTMTRRMVDATGCTPNAYLSKVRMCNAMRLLRQTDRPITEIAFACGYNDSNYFSSRFHRDLGLTPRQYRMQAHADLGERATVKRNLA